MNTILLDGGMGQELVRRSSRPVTPLWSSEVLLHEPDIVTQLHADYIAAGADVITLASYSATPERLIRDGVPDSFDDLQAAAARCAQQARDRAGKPSVRIGACLPPLVASYHAELVPTEEQALASYRRIVAAQRDTADVMLCETMSSIAEARYAATAALESSLPVWVAFTVADHVPEGTVPTLRSGESLADGVREIQALGVDAILVNCSSPESCSAALPTLWAPGVVAGVYANAFRAADQLQAGGTVEHLEARDDLGPDAYAGLALGWREQGAHIIGGCCETTPAHIQALSAALA